MYGTGISPDVASSYGSLQPELAEPTHDTQLSPFMIVIDAKLIMLRWCNSRQKYTYWLNKERITTPINSCCFFAYDAHVNGCLKSEKIEMDLIFIRVDYNKQK